MALSRSRLKMSTDEASDRGVSPRDRKQKGGAFASLSDADKDTVIGGLESGSAKLEGIDGQAFFELLLTNTREGFFADPIFDAA